MFFDCYRILNFNQRLIRRFVFVINTNKQFRPTATGVRRDFCLSRSTWSNTAKVHELIEPLSWLIGKWRSDNGHGIYPTIKDFSYGEELEFFHVGQPNIQFTSYSWHPETKKPLHREVGFIRRKPNTNTVAFLIAQNLGVCEIEEGTFTENEIKIESSSLGRLTFGSDPETKKVRRHFKRDGDTMELVLSMETVNTRMTEHLRIKYNRV